MTSPEQSHSQIPLTQGQVALVSPHRYADVAQFKWSARWCKETQSFYALRNSPQVNGKSHIIAMHRYILGLEYGDPRQGDHRNHDTLDNRDDNLRIVTRTQNAKNRRHYRSGRSGFKGVDFHVTVQRYRARISHNGRTLLLGYRDTPEEAYKLYCDTAFQLHGEFASLS